MIYFTNENRKDKQTYSRMAGTERQKRQLLKSPETKNNDMCINEGLINVAAWYRGTPDQSSRNSGNK